MRDDTPRSVKRKSRYWQSFFFIFVLFLAVYILFQSPLFLINNIVVRGNATLTAAEVTGVSGIITGVNIFKVDLETAAARVKALPVVKDVEISRRLPSTVIIRVIERTPVALVVANGEFVEIDAEGYYLRPGKVSTTGLPVVTGVQVKASKPGRRVEGEGLDTALQVVLQLPVELLANLSEVNIGSDGRVTLYTMEGVECRLGLPENVESKGSYIMQVLDKLRDRNAKSIEYVDFSIISSPVVKYRE